jgi:hypothetical protein
VYGAPESCVDIGQEEFENGHAYGIYDDTYGHDYLYGGRHKMHRPTAVGPGVYVLSSRRPT